MDKNKLEHISGLVYDLIVRQVSEQDKNTEYQEKFDNLVYDLRREIQDAKDLAKDFKDQELTFNTIEAEGYLRAMLTIESVINQYK